MHAHSVEYYIATAGFEDTWQARDAAARGGGGLAEYYSEKNTKLPTTLVVGDEEAVERLMGIRDGQLISDVDVRRWLDMGVAPSGLQGRKFQNARVDPVTKERVNPAIHGYDLTFAAPKELSILRALGDDGIEKVVLEAHQLGVRAAMEYAASHVAYTRVSNPDDPTRKDLVRLPGLAATVWQHETSRAGDMHLHSHLILANRQATADGRLATIDGTSLYHEAKAMGMLYQSVVRDHTHRLLGLEWVGLDPDTGMAKLAGMDRELVRAFSKRKSQLDEWAEANRPDSLDLDAVDEAAEAGNSLSKEARDAKAKWAAAAQKSTRPKKPGEKAWEELKAEWTASPEARAMFDQFAVYGRADPRRTVDARPTVDAVLRQARSERDQYRRADLMEAALGLWGPSVMDWRERLAAAERLVDEAAGVCYQVNENRAAHEREGHLLYTDELTVERAKEVTRLASRRSSSVALPITERWMAEAKARRDGKMSEEQAQAVVRLATSKWHVNVLEAAAGTGKTTTLTALRERAEETGKRVLFLTTQRALVAEVKEKGLFSDADTIAAELLRVGEGRHGWSSDTLVVVDEAGMVGNESLRKIMRAAVDAGAKAVFVGDSHQLQPVKAAGGLFRHLSEQLPWTVELNEVWRQKDPLERAATLALRDAKDHTAIDDAIKYYADRGRLNAGDERSMCDGALKEYNRHTAMGRDTLLMSDKWKIANSLNRRIQLQHHDLYGRTDDDAHVQLDPDEGQRAYIGDIILTRENSRDIQVWSATDPGDRSLRVNNADRWTVVGVWNDGSAEVVRIRDKATSRLPAEYLRENALLGWATTLHPKQGATAEVGLPVLHKDTGQRWMGYPALTRGELENHLFIIESAEGEKDHQHRDPDAPREPVVRTVEQAAAAFKQIILADDRERALADVAEEAVQNLLDRRDLGEQVEATGISAAVWDLAVSNWAIRLSNAEQHAADLSERDARIEREKAIYRDRIERAEAFERERAQRGEEGRERDDGPDIDR